MPLETLYQCLLCGNNPDQISHHKRHLNSKKHKDQVTIFKLTLEKMSQEELIEKYSDSNIDNIVKNHETKVINKKQEVTKKKKTNKLIFEKSKNEVEETNKDENFKSEFINFIGKMHNLLRGSAVTGDQALDDILNILFLCYIEDKISDSGDFDLMNSEKSCYKGIFQRKVKDFCKCISTDYLIKHPEELRCKSGLNSVQKCAEVLSRHLKTKTLFRDNKDFINCQDITTLQSLLTQCKDFSVKNNIFEYSDIIGYAYEYMTTKHAGNGGTSKEMGQYFTERPLMSMCYELIDPEDIQQLGINDDSTLGDEFCATFGFPLTARAFFRTRFKINIQDKNMYGVEYHERLSRFAYMNAMFAMKNTRYITHGDSFITNIKPHLDISVHNVPFGKSMTPKNIEKNYNLMKEKNPDKNYPDFNDIIPFNSKKIDAILASQVVLYKTKKMGLIILKDGEETSGKSNDKYRKWFMENCVIKKIMKIPSGAFSCTGTKTVCIYFIKKEGQQTENIQFLQLSDDGNKITEVCNVSIDDMKYNNYSWDPNSYVVDEEMEKMMSKSKCEWKKLGEVCKILPTTKHYTKIGKKDGNYRFYNSSQKDKLYLDTFEVDKESVIIGNGGELCIHYDTKFTASKHVSVIQTNKKNVLTKYICYYLLNNISMIKKLSTGAGIQWLNKEKINSIKIPIPLLEIQNTVVETLDDLVEQKQLLTNRKSGIERQMKYYFETQIKKMVNNSDGEWKKIGDVCNFKNGKQLSKKDYIKGDYYVIGGGQTPSGKHNTFNRNKNSILCSQSGSYAGFISRYDTPIWASDCFSIEPINKNIINENYLYYYFKNVIQDNIYKLQKGGGQPHVYSSNLSLLKLPIISIEKQTGIVQYLDKLEAKKNSINDEINDIDILMKNILEQSYC